MIRDAVPLCVSRHTGARASARGQARSKKRKKRACLAHGAAFSARAAICPSLRGVNSRASRTFSSSCATESQPMITVLTGARACSTSPPGWRSCPAVGDDDALPRTASAAREAAGSRSRAGVRGRDLHADDAHLLLDREGQEAGHEAVVVPVGRVQRHQDRVEREAADRVHEGLGAVMAREAEEADHPLLARLEEGLHGAALREDLAHVPRRPDVVELQRSRWSVFSSFSDCSSMRSEASRVRSFVLLARNASERRRFITWPM